MANSFVQYLVDILGQPNKMGFKCSYVRLYVLRTYDRYPHLERG